MPSVMGLLEEREVAARQRVESLRDELDRLVAELEMAEAARDRLVIAKETVSQVLSEAGEPDDVHVSRGGPAGCAGAWGVRGGAPFGRAGVARGT